MAKSSRSLLANRLAGFKQAVGERYPDVDIDLATSKILDGLSSLLRDGYDAAGVKIINSRRARIVVLGVEDEQEGEE